MRGACYRIERRAGAAGGGQDAAQETGQLVQIVVAVAGAAGVIQLAEGGVDQIVAVQGVTIPVVTVLEAVGVGAVAGHDPALIDNATEAVQARVLVARISVCFAGLLDVGQIDAGLRMGAADDRAQAEVVIRLKGTGGARERCQAANDVLKAAGGAVGGSESLAPGVGAG